MKLFRRHRRHRRSRSHRKNMRMIRACAALLVLFAFGAGIALLVEHFHKEDIENAEEQLTVYESVRGMPTIFVNGGWYAERDIESLLVIGVDDLGEITGADSYNSGSQADFMVLLMRDRDTNESAALHINRDTMTQVPILGVTGQRAGSRWEQIALAYYYGKGEQDSCENTVNAVSNLLYGVEIDHYLAVTMDAVPIMNDWVGGVRLEMLDDFSDINPDMVKGEKVLLWGEDALHYVQVRAGLDDSSNLNRMNRQRQYASAWFDKARPMMTDYKEVAQLFSDLQPYHYSDCSVDELKNVMEAFSKYPPENVYEIAGEAAVESVYMEYHADEAALQQMVLDLFYRPVEN